MATADGLLRISVDFDSSPIKNELNSLCKSLEDLTKTIKETFDESVMKSFAQSLKDISSALDSADVFDYIGAVSNILSIFETLPGIIVAVVGKEALASAALAGIINATIIWQGICTAASAVTTAFGAAMEFLLGPVGLIILAVAALITIVILLVENWDLVKEKAIEIWTAISDFFIELWATITEAVIVAWQAIVDFIVGLWTGISETAIEVWTVISDFFTQLWATITTAAIVAWQVVVSFIVGVWTGISETAIAVWTVIADFFTQLWLTITTAATTAWQAIVEFIVGIWTGISGIAIELWTPIADFFTGLLDGIKLTFSSAWEGIKEVWGVVAQWFTDNIISPVQKAFDGFKTAVIGAWNAIWAGIKNVINQILGGIECFINGIIGGVNNLIAGLNSVISMGSKVTEALGLGSIGSINSLGGISLPRLAKGAVIPPNREFAAILGDQKHGLNIETPLDTMIEAFKIALNDMGNTGSNAPIYITVESKLDGKSVARNQVKYLPGEYNRLGPSAVKVGA